MKNTGFNEYEHKNFVIHSPDEYTWFIEPNMKFFGLEIIEDNVNLHCELMAKFEEDNDLSDGFNTLMAARKWIDEHMKNK